MSEFLNILKWIKKRDAVSPSAIMESFPLTEEEAKKQLDNLIALGYVENGEDGENEVSLGGLGLVEIHSLSSIIERLIEVQDLSRYAVISYSDEDVYPGFPTGISVFYSNTPDIDFPYIDDFVSFFPEAKRMAAFIKENVESGKVIICQCEYGQSRSAGTAAANAVTGKKGKTASAKDVAGKAVTNATSSAIKTLTRSLLGNLVK